MLLLYEAIALAIIFSIFTKGKFTNLAKLQFNKLYLVFLSFGLKYGFDTLAFKGYAFNSLTVILMQFIAYVMLFVFLYYNVSVPGIKIMSLGMFLNFLVIMANGGAMPTNTSGLEKFYLDLLLQHKVVTHTLFTPQTRLPWLADIFTQTFPQVKKFSIGDVFISIGVFYLVWAVMHKKDNANYRLNSTLSKTRLIS